MLEVKQANENDVAILAQLGATTFYETFRPYNSEEDMQLYITKSYNEELIATNLKNTFIHYALVLNDGIPVGYLKLLLNTTHEKLEGKNIELEKNLRTTIEFRKRCWKITNELRSGL